MLVLTAALSAWGENGSKRSVSNANRKLVMEGDGALVWHSAAGRSVRALPLSLTVEEPTVQGARAVRVKLEKQSVRGSEAVLEYSLSLDENGLPRAGTATSRLVLPQPGQGDTLIWRADIAFDKPVRANLRANFSFEVKGPMPDRVVVPQRDGVLGRASFPAAGSFMLGSAAKGGTGLGMPVMGFEWTGEGTLQLAVAADPFCGSTTEGARGQAGALISVTTTYPGLEVPVRTESRTLALEFHRGGADRTLLAFYRTIPEIEPGAAWIQGVHLVYYDYLSEKGEGWFRDLKALADHISAPQRGHVALCMHGWYDYFQHYAYDDTSGQLLKEWTAFPGTYKVPMSRAEMHRRLKYAKELGFRVLLYFCDGTNSDDGAPNFNKDYLLKDKTGKTFPGWKGPDSLGQPWMMDPSAPGLRDWYRRYLKALLEEYADDLDGFVWDETFYIPVGFVACGSAGPSHADRVMMSLVAELTRMVQSYHRRNPDLVLLAADNGSTSYALVAHGTYQDSGAREKHWGPSMFANYRNCLWSCNWTPIQNDADNRIAAEKYGLPQGLSNGWGDNCGPSRMAPELLEAVLKRFTANVESNRQRLRYLTPEESDEKRP